MLDFQPKKTPRKWTSRGEQRRMLMLVGLAAGVLILFSVAGNPRMYAWFTEMGKPKKVIEDAHVDTRVQPSTTARDLKAGLFAVTADRPADGPVEETAAAGDRFPGVRMEYFGAIKDNTLYRESDVDAWFHLLGIANNTPQETLERSSRGRVTFLQLFRQPDAYRAELVSVAGTVHRVVRYEIPTNYEDLSGEYFQVWLQPENSAHPVVVYSLSLPEDFPVADDMKESAEVTGFFFKIWAYAAKEEPRTAPILLAKTLRWNEQRVRRTYDRPAVVPTERPKSDAPTQSPREYVAEKWDFTDDVWQRFVDGQAIAAADESREDEAATLLKLVNNLSRLPTESVEAWTQDEAGLATLVDDPSAHRGEIFRIEGRATRCERVVIGDELAKFFDFEAVYRTEIRPDDAGPVCVVYSPAAPRGWLRDANGKMKPSAQLDERTAAVAMFVKRGGEYAIGNEAGDDAARPSLVFVARRLSWWPISLLAQLGMDMALFDEVVQGTEIAGSEAECLYSMLARAPSIDRGELDHLAREYQFKLQNDFPYEYQNPYDPSNSFVLNEVRSRPVQSAGVAASLSATALRAFRVQMNADDTAKYGFDHYYHIDASVPLDPPITVVQRTKAAAAGGAANGADAGDGAAEAGTTTETRRDDMSVVFCVRRLPEGFPEGEKINESIRVPGFFFKTWAASSPKSVEINPRSRHQYPMFIADSIVWYSEGESSYWLGGTIVAVLVGMLVLGGIGAMINRRGNRDLDKTLVRQRTASDAALDALQVPAQEPPDFGFLGNEVLGNEVKNPADRVDGESTGDSGDR